MNKLPIYNGWTIDLRLKQFRKVSTPENPSIEFVDFNSDEGKGLIKEFCEEKVEYHTEEARIYQSNIFDLESDIDEDTLYNLAEEMIEVEQ